MWIRPSYCLAGACPLPMGVGKGTQPLQCLLSYWVFSDIGHRMSPHGPCSEAQPLLLTLDVGYLLIATCSSNTQVRLLTLDLGISALLLKLKKVEKMTRPFRYDLNQIPYNYTVKVTNRFKGLYMIDRVPNELWTEVRDIVQETGIKITPNKRKCKKVKWLSEQALQIAVKRREVKSKGENERYTHLNAEFQRIASRNKKAFLSDQCKEIEENNRMGKTRDFFKNIRYQGIISCKDGHHKGQKQYGPNRSRRY